MTRAKNCFLIYQNIFQNDKIHSSKRKLYFVDFSQIRWSLISLSKFWLIPIAEISLMAWEWLAQRELWKHQPALCKWFETGTAPRRSEILEFDLKAPSVSFEWRPQNSSCRRKFCSDCYSELPSLLSWALLAHREKCVSKRNSKVFSSIGWNVSQVEEKKWFMCSRTSFWISIYKFAVSQHSYPGYRYYLYFHSFCIGKSALS